jgi:hypothetical protein
VARRLQFVGGVRVIIISAIACASGCQAIGWDNVPGAAVRAESFAPGVSNDAWRDEVQRAMNTWATHLEPLGCAPPFVMSSDTVGDHQVELIDNANWDYVGIDGVTYGDAPTQPAGSIAVRTGPADPFKGPAWRYSVLLHELGHAIGLDHSDPANGPSIMTPRETAWTLTGADVAAAACLIGCGPCGTTTDPYDGVD